MSKPVVHIRDWKLVPNGAHGLTLMGVPMNHQNHSVGQMVSNTKLVQTSAVINVDLDAGLVETLNTIYALDGPAVSDERLIELWEDAFSTPPAFRVFH